MRHIDQYYLNCSRVYGLFRRRSLLLKLSSRGCEIHATILTKGARESRLCVDPSSRLLSIVPTPFNCVGFDFLEPRESF